MDDLIFLLFLFLTFGWVLPPWSWGIVLLLIGIGIALTSLIGLCHPRGGGFIHVLICTAGLFLALVGLAMIDEDAAQALVEWLAGLPDGLYIAVMFGTGAIARLLLGNGKR